MKNKDYKQTVFGTTNTTSRIQVSYNPETDSITIDSIDQKTLRSVLSYERASGKEKIVSQVHGLGIEQSIDANKELLKYDIIIVIDTNSIVINGLKYSISLSAISIPASDNSINGLSFEYFCSFCFKNKEINNNPEMIGWYLLLERHFRNNLTKSTLLITDSELGKHIDLNTKNVEYMYGHYFPSNIKIGYGSADTAKSKSIACSMISYCDKNINRLLPLVKNKLEQFEYSYEDENIYGFADIITVNDRNKDFA